MLKTIIKGDLMYIMVAIPWSFSGLNFGDCRRCLLASDFARDGAMSLGNRRTGRQTSYCRSANAAKRCFDCWSLSPATFSLREVSVSERLACVGHPQVIGCYLASRAAEGWELSCASSTAKADACGTGHGERHLTLTPVRVRSG